MTMARDKEAKREYQRAWREANREYINQWTRQWNSSPERRAKIVNNNAKRKELYQKDPVVREQRKSQQTEYRKRTVDVIKERSRKRYLKQRENPLYKIYAAGYGKASRDLLKMCPHCGGEVSLKAWRKVLSND